MHLTTFPELETARATLLYILSVSVYVLNERDLTGPDFSSISLVDQTTRKQVKGGIRTAHIKNTVIVWAGGSLSWVHSAATKTDVEWEWIWTVEAPGAPQLWVVIRWPCAVCRGKLIWQHKTWGHTHMWECRQPWGHRLVCVGVRMTVKQQQLALTVTVCTSVKQLVSVINAFWQCRIGHLSS